MTLKSRAEGVPADTAQADHVENRAAQVEAILLNERALVSGLVTDLARDVPNAFSEAARRWASGESQSSLVEEAEAALVRLAARAVNETQELLRRTRTALAGARDGVMREAEGRDWTGTGLTLDLLSCPALPSARLPRSPGPVPARWRRFPQWSERRGRDALTHLTRAAATVLARFGEELRNWALGQLERLAVQVAADTEPVRARLRRVSNDQAHCVDMDSIEADLAALGCETDVVPVTLRPSGCS